MEDRPAADRIVVLGRITGVFGVQGWVKIQSYTDPPGNLFEYDIWQLGQRGTWSPTQRAEGRQVNRGVIARFRDYTDRDQAQELIGREIGVWRSEMPALPPGEFYWEDLTGLDAYTATGDWLGKVDHFRETGGSHPLIVIRGEREHLVPCVRDRLLKVELAAGRLTLDWGLDW